jgi:hypothetical protein
MRAMKRVERAMRRAVTAMRALIPILERLGYRQL